MMKFLRKEDSVTRTPYKLGVCAALLIGASALAQAAPKGCDSPFAITKLYGDKIEVFRSPDSGKSFDAIRLHTPIAVLDCQGNMYLVETQEGRVWVDDLDVVTNESVKIGISPEATTFSGSKHGAGRGYGEGSE